MLINNKKYHPTLHMQVVHNVKKNHRLICQLLIYSTAPVFAYPGYIPQTGS